MQCVAAAWNHSGRISLASEASDCGLEHLVPPCVATTGNIRSAYLCCNTDAPCASSRHVSGVVAPVLVMDMAETSAVPAPFAL
eukprot:SAG11_NODE_5140_length_1653_cov_1.241313_2_plen_83_part_00